MTATINYVDMYHETNRHLRIEMVHHGSYKQRLMELKAFRPDSAIFKALSLTKLKREPWQKPWQFLVKKTVSHMIFTFILPCEQTSNNNKNILLIFLKTGKN